MRGTLPKPPARKNAVPPIFVPTGLQTGASLLTIFFLHPAGRQNGGVLLRSEYHAFKRSREAAIKNRFQLRRLVDVHEAVAPEADHGREAQMHLEGSVLYRRGTPGCR